jgi:hypothetical protein
MSQSTETRNKAIVLEAFDTLFNKRDYVAAARFWSPNYVQHSAHIEPGRDGLFNLIKNMPPTFKHEHEQVVADARRCPQRASFTLSTSCAREAGLVCGTARRHAVSEARPRCHRDGLSRPSSMKPGKSPIKEPADETWR